METPEEKIAFPRRHSRKEGGSGTVPSFFSPVSRRASCFLAENGFVTVPRKANFYFPPLFSNSCSSDAKNFIVRQIFNKSMRAKIPASYYVKGAGALKNC